MKIYLTFKQNARLYSWLIQNRDLCKRVTGKYLLNFVSKPIAQVDLGPLPYTHCDFPDDVQWWINQHCPYPFAKSPVRAKLKTKILNWSVYKVHIPQLKKNVFHART